MTDLFGNPMHASARLLYEMGDRYPAGSEERETFYRRAAEAQRRDEERLRKAYAADQRTRQKREEIRARFARKSPR